MKSPLIGITANALLEGLKESGRRGDVENAVPQAYVDAVEDAGGTPVLIPLVRNPSTAHRILESLDGLLLSGGGDIDPALYGEEPDPNLKVVDVEKDKLEKELIARALAKNYPLLGICRGMQILNVVAGGTLIQDIPSTARSSIQHLQRATAPVPIHRITLKKGSHLQKIAGQASLRVNSYHHQAVKKIAPGFEITATAPDGIVEGIESRRHRFVLGVQFHPEMMFREFPVFKKIFQKLVQEAAAKHAH